MTYLEQLRAIDKAERDEIAKIHRETATAGIWLMVWITLIVGFCATQMVV